MPSVRWPFLSVSRFITGTRIARRTGDGVGIQLPRADRSSAARTRPRGAKINTRNIVDDGGAWCPEYAQR